ncbi:unnamed protein product [Calypogeia fissa]
MFSWCTTIEFAAAGESSIDLDLLDSSLNISEASGTPGSCGRTSNWKNLRSCTIAQFLPTNKRPADGKRIISSRKALTSVGNV